MKRTEKFKVTYTTPGGRQADLVVNAETSWDAKAEVKNVASSIQRVDFWDGKKWVEVGSKNKDRLR